MQGWRYIEDHGDRLVVRPCAEDALGRGATLAFVAAPAIVITASVSAWIVAGEDAVAFFVGWGAGAAIASVLATIGLVRMARARASTSGREVWIDLAERVVERRGEPVQVLSGVSAVRVRGGRSPWSGFTLALVHDDGRVNTLLTVPRAQGRALAKSAEHLADALDTKTDVSRAARGARPLLPTDPRLASALCCAPFDGLFVAMSVWYLMTSTDPFVRFNAKQSLALFAMSGALALLLMGCCGLPFGLLAPSGFVAASLALPLLVLAAARIVVRTMAAMRAHRGQVWVQPWLAFVSRRWAP